MELDYPQQGKVTVRMENFTCDCIKKIPEDLPKTVETPAYSFLFTIRDKDSQKQRPLPEDRTQTFHQMVAHLLFLVARSRRDCKNVISFLTARMKDPDKDGWGKLRRFLRYLKQNPSLGLTLEASNLNMIHLWVDV
jgi:hypothetical protein